MVRVVASDPTRAVLTPRPDIGSMAYVPQRRSKRLWRTSPRRRTAAEADGSLDVTARPICGRCIATSRSTGQRCSRNSCLDYRYCMQHLHSEAHLAIAPSRRLSALGVPNKALGLYAAHAGVKFVKDSLGFPLAPYAQPRFMDPRTRMPQSMPAVVFRTGDVVTPYGGEMLTRAQFNERYQDPADMDNAAYAAEVAARPVYERVGGKRVRSLDPATGEPLTLRQVVDGLAAASAASYSNEALNVRALMLRARDRADFERLYDAEAAKAENVSLVNVRANQRGGVPTLFASKPIAHGAEVLWNYGSSYWAAESMKRALTGAGW